MKKLASLLTINGLVPTYALKQLQRGWCWSNIFENWLVIKRSAISTPNSLSPQTSQNFFDETYLKHSNFSGLFC